LQTVREEEEEEEDLIAKKAGCEILRTLAILVPKSVTLVDLERRFGCLAVLFFLQKKINASV